MKARNSQQEITNAARLHECVRSFSVRLTLADLLPHIIDLAVSVGGVQGVSIVLVDPDLSQPVLRARWQTGMHSPEITKLPVEAAMVERVL
jgi:hypothetical protein